MAYRRKPILFTYGLLQFFYSLFFEFDYFSAPETIDVVMVRRSTCKLKEIEAFPDVNRLKQVLFYKKLYCPVYTCPGDTGLPFTESADYVAGRKVPSTEGNDRRYNLFPVLCSANLITFKQVIHFYTN